MLFNHASTGMCKCCWEWGAISAHGAADGRHQTDAKSNGCGACRTYTTLIQQGKGRTRLQQVMDWCGGPDWDGPLIFDEASPLFLILSESLLG